MYENIPAWLVGDDKYQIFCTHIVTGGRWHHQIVTDLPSVDTQFKKAQTADGTAGTCKIADLKTLAEYRSVRPAALAAVFTHPVRGCKKLFVVDHFSNSSP